MRELAYIVAGKMWRTEDSDVDEKEELQICLKVKWYKIRF